MIEPQTERRCTPILIQWCPACFGGTMFGKPTAEGGDIHTATDGNFHHHHQRAVGDSPHFMTLLIFFQKSMLNIRGLPSHLYPLFPMRLLTNAKQHMKQLMGKHRSIISYLCLATTVMHAYGHEWACQLVHNPRMYIGLGLSDGEGTERLWSRLCGINDQGTAAQEVLDWCELSVKDLELMLEKGTASQDTLKALEKGHDHLMAKVKVLYAFLNNHNQFPELKGINLDSVQLLLMAHKLDCAVGGAQQVLGTKLHQQTRKAIAKCRPALLTALRKFNGYYEHLEALYDSSWGIPLPSPLPTKLAELCGDPSLMEDVWIIPSMGQVPRWLEDADKGLGIEADNLCCFFGEELAALELAQDTGKLISVLLRQCCNQLLRLQTRWTNPLASSLCFMSCAKDALEIAITLSGSAQTLNMHWLSTTLLEVPDPEGELNDVKFAEPHDLPAVESEHAALADVLEGDLGREEVGDFDSMDYINDAHAVIMWEAPKVHQSGII
ncbi:hypothetical protein DFH29DRAFT_982784 [Suillus ampliporus]|nr:hypothetical protein DFH29DRAFT_982784 [Suillus ampliporus]